MLPQQYCLRWRYHHSNLQTMFSALLEREAFCDVTLACENRTIKAHKIVLSACSTYFETILSQYEEKDPILIMKDVKYVDIRCLVEFMYKGEINVDHCHLATLLKTAEELKIKGLAEVSWRDEDQQQSHNNSDQGGAAAAAGSSNGYQSTALPHVSTVMNDPKTSDTSGLPSAKRKRGRPPIDDYEQAFPTPRIMNVQGNAHHHEENYSNDAMSTSDHDLSIWEEEPSANEAGDTTEPDEPTIRVKTELSMMDDDCMIDDQYSRQHDNSMKGSKSSSSNTTTPASGSQSFLTPALEREWQDVVKMNDYLNTGRRQQFWEEPFTKRVMEGIQKKSLEMKVAAELLGVSYGTLYGRYRDTYGCLKHPYRARDFWTEQIPTDIVSKLRRKEITLGRAAEQLNVTPQTLSSYLTTAAELNTMSNQLNNSNQSNASINVMACYDEGDSEEDALGDTVLPDNPSSNNTSLFKKILCATAAAAAANGNTANHHITTTAKTTSASGSSSSNSVLANCPDITIIKKEKYDGGSSKFNNNSDHSDSTNNSDQANNQ